MRAAVTLAVLCFAGASGAETPAPTFSTAPAVEGKELEKARDIFIATIESNGCRMSEAEASEKLPAVGLNFATTRKLTETLVAEGVASFADDGITLKTENCR